MIGPLRNPLLVARREYLARVRTRAFVILTLFVAIAGVVVVLLPVALRAMVTEGEARIAVAWDAEDFAGDPVGALVVQLGVASGHGAGGGSGFRVTPTEDPADARQQVDDGRLDGLLILQRSSSGELAFSYHSQASPNGRQVTLVRQAASALAVQDRMERLGIGQAQQTTLFAPVDFTLSVASGRDDAQQQRSPQELAGRLAAVTSLVVLVFAAIVTYGQWIATSVAEEKSSRVMELLITAASSRELLAGKVIGAGAAGVTQYVAVVVPAAVTVSLQDRIAAAITGDEPATGGGLAAVDLPLLLAFGLFFVLAFGFYALLYAAAGSLATRTEEVQQIAMPMMLLLTAGYAVSFLAFEDTQAGWVRVLSYVPFFSPTLMIARLGLGRVEPWEIGLAVALLIIGIALAYLFAARVYRAGILLYGQRRGLRSVLRATRVSR